ncbi:MAG: hypothetical protein EBR20_04140 [Bacteroidetes bacterium]|nr:hypothetical protein [Bacteroidota bacterium]
MFSTERNTEHILAITVSSQRLEGILLHDAPSGPVILRTFRRSRAEAGQGGLDEASPAFDGGLDEGGQLEDAAFADHESQSLASGMFLTSEFDATGEDADMSMSFEWTTQTVVPCDQEIKELVSECKQAGYDRFQIVFILPTEFLGSEMLGANAIVKAGAGGFKGRKKRDALLRQFLSDHPDLSPEKVTLLPLSDFEGTYRKDLAVYATSSEPISPSVQALRDRKEDNTLVMFLVGEELVHCESLRSITATDPAETICSRVLLMHDELGVGDSDRILLFADEYEGHLRNTLSRAFPESRMVLLRDLVPSKDGEAPAEKSLESMLARLGALSMAGHDIWESAFPDVDFMDPELRGKQLRLPLSWPIAAIMVVLFCTTLFFVYSYLDQDRDIERARFELSQYQDGAETENIADLQAKIDSLKARSAGFADALDLLDSLLVGSDVWSRALERTSAYTGDVSGLWISEWQEESEGSLFIAGRSLNREDIVAFASRTQGRIENITFAEIRSVPVYEFEMTMAITRTLPEAAEYLRKEAASRLKEGASDPQAALSGAASAIVTLAEEAGR